MGRACRTAAEAAQAARRYAGLLEGEPAQQLWPGTLQQQLHLGDDAFVGRMQALAGPSVVAAAEVPRAQRRSALVADGGRQPPVESWSTPSPARTAAPWRAYGEEGVTMTVLAARWGLSVSSVSRLIAAVEGQKARPDLTRPHHLNGNTTGIATVATARKTSATGAPARAKSAKV